MWCFRRSWASARRRGPLSMGRKFMGTELHPAYYRQAVKNIEEQADQGQQANLFELLEIA